jgi:hypothetical protein
MISEPTRSDERYLEEKILSLCLKRESSRSLDKTAEKTIFVIAIFCEVLVV